MGWSMAAAQLILATDPRNLTESMKEILFNKDLIQLNQDPLGIAGGVVEESGGHPLLQVWARPLHDGAIAVALYNAGNTTATITSHFEKLPVSRRLHNGIVSLGSPWRNTTRVHVYDLWKHDRSPDSIGKFQ